VVTNKKVPGISAPVPEDEAAKEEQALIQDGNLESAKKKNEENELGRADRLRHHIYCASVIAIWALFAIVFASLLSLTWYYIGPKSWQWLTEDQVGFIKGALLSGGGGALLSSTMNHYLKK